jgi:Tol biopolymer transport system component
MGRLRLWSTIEPTVLLVALVLLVLVLGGCASDEPDAGQTDATTGRLMSQGRIAFSVDTEDVYVFDLGTSSVMRLTTDPAWDFDPTWSPDGSRIAFRSERDGNPEIYVMNADGSEQVNLTRNPAEDFSPAWSPDGTKIAFASSRDGLNMDIFVMNPDGSEPTNLTKHAGIDEYPTWSPDGTKLAFSSNRDGHPAIYTMNTDGSELVQLTSNGDDNLPAWSPDGKRIVFHAQREGNDQLHELYIMRSDGTGLRRLTTTLGISPAWSPDGTFIVFAAEDGSGLYRVKPDGTGEAQVLARNAALMPALTR